MYIRHCCNKYNTPTQRSIKQLSNFLHRNIPPQEKNASTKFLTNYKLHVGPLLRSACPPRLANTIPLNMYKSPAFLVISVVTIIPNKCCIIVTEPILISNKTFIHLTILCTSLFDKNPNQTCISKFHTLIYLYMLVVLSFKHTSPPITT